MPKFSELKHCPYCNKTMTKNNKYCTVMCAQKARGLDKKEKAPIKGANNNSQPQYNTEDVTNQEWSNSRADRSGW